MIDIKKQRQKELAKEKTRRRMNVQIDPDNYVYYPEEKQVDPFDQFAEYRVVIYVRVSTDDVKQTTSYELQKKYYEDFVVHHPNWTLVHIYADATVIIGLKQNPTNGRRFSPIFLLYRAFCGAKHRMPL